jgi:hypothetical protein
LPGGDFRRERSSSDFDPETVISAASPPDDYQPDISALVLERRTFPGEGGGKMFFF